MTDKKRHPLSPSSADRWVNCHGYYELVRDIPPRPPSKWAQEGTEAHGILELALLTGLHPSKLTRNPVIIKNVGFAFDYADPLPGIVLPERKVGIDFRDMRVKGTADVSHIFPAELEVVDYKHGAGVYVEDKNNPQLSIYLGALREEFQRRKFYRRTVIQPRIFGRAPIRSQVVSNDELDDLLDTADKALSRNLRGSHGPTAGHWCRFCPAMGVCPAARRKAIDKDFG